MVHAGIAGVDPGCPNREKEDAAGPEQIADTVTIR
jgi:hypothetical protein